MPELAPVMKTVEPEREVCERAIANRRSVESVQSNPAAKIVPRQIPCGY
jgi:hypothetical protein